MEGWNGGFRHWQVSGLAISSIAACFSSPSIRSVDFASFQPLKRQHSPSRLVCGFHSCPNFCTITFAHHSIPHCLPNVNMTDTTSHVQLANFSILFGRSFCEQQLVLGKLSNTVKWSTFCVSFVHMLTILSWLKCFKTNYLVTSNVQFGMISINPVTYENLFID